ncbi:hypothetical protein XENORESO_010192 [Xenotaenia resolanae]|uniref:Uncharacterized protein n=1 Tax=Xenotaenia resolanae TaxID=208358 RepID=A0ABV0WAW3_9TELE
MAQSTALFGVFFLLSVLVFKGFSSPPSGKEVWDYVEVRPGAHMFWWLYYSDSPSAQHQDLPLVMWLQVKKKSDQTEHLDGFLHFNQL